MSFRRLYQQLKNVYHFLQAYFWRTWYRFPDRALTLYGVTGTNGKTTTCHILAGVLAADYGKDKVGMITTIAVRIGERDSVNETKLTTLPSQLVYKYLSQMKQVGVEQAVVEMTSHALDQHRLAGIQLAGAIVTHIEREHLNYHGTMEEYVAAKQRIVSYLRSSAPLVGNRDNAWVNQILEFGASHGANVVGYSGEEIESSTTPLLGAINRENALAVRKLAHALGLTSEDVERGVAAVDHVPGRMEKVENDRGLNIIIDYAVTPQALEKLYQSVAPSTEGKILATLGAAGLRDRGKRPDMARVVAKYVDVIAVTREDPWTENEEQIFQDLEEGLTGADALWRRIVDRSEAIAWLLTQAKPGDAVVVTGKGAETGMGIGKEIVSYNERETIEQILDKLAD